MPWGVDVSSHQPPGLPWGTWWAANGIKFAYIRASIGYVQDSLFLAHRAQARQARVLTGVYHALLHHDPEVAYFNPSRQARVFAGRLGAAADDELAPAVDVEAAGITEALLDEFIGEFERLTGRRLVIYTSRAKWHELIGRGQSKYAKYPLWCADYNGPLDLPDIWTQALIHQTSGTGKLPGYAGDIDLDRWLGAWPPGSAGNMAIASVILMEDVPAPLAEAVRQHLEALAADVKQGKCAPYGETVVADDRWWAVLVPPYQLPVQDKEIQFYAADGVTPLVKKKIAWKMDVFERRGGLLRTTDFGTPGRPDWWAKADELKPPGG